MTADVNSRPADGAGPRRGAVPANMLRVCLVRRQGEAEGLESLLHEVSAVSTAVAFLGDLPPAAAPRAGPGERAADVVVVAEGVSAQSPLVAGALALGMGVVAITADPETTDWAGLAADHPVVFAPGSVDCDGLRSAVASAAASSRRLAVARDQVQELEQRLADHILLKRAKGVLVQRLKISEDQAYKRMRVLARRQRRPMRDVAKNLLDAQALLDPEVDGLTLAEGTD